MRRLQEIAREKGISVVIGSHDQRIRDIAARAVASGRAIQGTEHHGRRPGVRHGGRVGDSGRRRGRGQTFYFCSRGCRAEYSVDV
jgi:hypothetical protein